MRRHAFPLLVGATAALVVAGVASAYFSAAGSGSAAAATVNMDIEVVAFVGGDEPNTRLVPGGAAADVILRVSNPNAFAVDVVSIEGNGTITADATHAACLSTGVTFNPPATPAISIEPGSSLVHLPGAATMATTSHSACQGASFAIPVALTVKR